MKRLTPSEAVRFIIEQYGEQLTETSLKAWMRSGRCPFGEYVRKPGNQRGQFLIFRERIDRYFRPQHDIGRALVDKVYIAQGGQV